MLFVTIINWKRKLLVILKLFLFLLLIGLIIPQFLAFIADEMVDLKGQPEEIQPPAMRVEQEKQSVQETTFLEMLRQFYYGEGAGPEYDR